MELEVNLNPFSCSMFNSVCRTPTSSLRLSPFIAAVFVAVLCISSTDVVIVNASSVSDASARSLPSDQPPPTPPPDALDVPIIPSMSHAVSSPDAGSVGHETTVLLPVSLSSRSLQPPATSWSRRDICIRGHLVQQRPSGTSRDEERGRVAAAPDGEYDGAEADVEGAGGDASTTVEVSPNRTDAPVGRARLHDDGRLMRRKFHIVNAAQGGGSSEVEGGEPSFLGRLRDTSVRDQSSVVGSRLLYGAVALVSASVLTPLVCLAIGFARTMIKRRLERRRRYDKSGEYERVGSVSSVVDSSVNGGSQLQLDGYLDDPRMIEDVTII